MATMKPKAAQLTVEFVAAGRGAVVVLLCAKPPCCRKPWEL
jgi:hypothetical protein